MGIHVRSARAEFSRPARGRSLAERPSVFQDLFDGVDWSLPLVAFMYYFFVVTTYWLKFADIAIVVALVTLPTQRFPLRFGRVLFVFGVFVGWCWITQTSSEFPAITTQSAWGLTKLWAIAFVAYNVIRTQAQLRMFFAFALVCFILFPVRGAFVNYFGGYNTFGRALWNFAYGNPNDLAAFGLLFGSMGLGLVALSRNIVIRLGALAAVGLIFLLILFTQSRGALVASGLMLMAILVPRIKNPRSVLATVFLVGVAVALAPRSVWDRIGGLANVSISGGMANVDAEKSAEQRFQIMRIASRIASDHPILGIGAGAYSVAHSRYQLKFASEFPIAGGERDAHSTYLRTAAETGFVGLAIFCTMVFGMLIWSFRASRRKQARNPELVRFLSYGLAAFLLAGVFGSFAYLSVLYLYLSLLESVLRDMEAPAGAPHPLIRSRNRVRIGRGVSQRALPVHGRS